MGKLDGKVALINGSGRNIGRATALKLAGEGAHIVVNARTNQAEADAVAAEIVRKLPADFVMVGVLKGAWVFVADLARALDRAGNRPEIEFMRLAS